MNCTIRPCESIEDSSSCVLLQKKTWGYSDREVYPARMFLNVPRIGGHVLGAFAPDGHMAGFVVSISGWRKQHRYYHSLLLGVLPEHENRGLGRMLKIAQRKAALRAGVDYIEWSFDPLRAKNAYFNIVCLGAIVRRYHRDYYGPVRSKLQRKLPSDRLIAEWRLRSPMVNRALAGEDPRPARKAASAEVYIPPDLDALLAGRSGQARRWQSTVRESLEGCFSRNLAITGFVRSRTDARYLLDRL